jgi:alpha-D-ribose 1-methylphosphonate 5-triphosphate synthase subunit PhnG
MIEQPQRQQLLSTLARSSFSDIEQHWNSDAAQHQYQFIRKPETGMVMAVGRAGGNGEPFNMGEVTVSRCTLRLESGETGFGYVRGRNLKHVETIALIDAISQRQDAASEHVVNELLPALQQKLQQNKQQKQSGAEQTRVDFFTMVRGESE